MPAVANVRVNTQVPFPAMVTGAAFISLTKVNGVWQIVPNGDLIASANPGVVATDFVLVWDAVAKGWIKISLSNLITVAASVRAQRLVTASPIVIAPTDSIINVNIGAGAPTCALPQASSRAGAALAFKDVGANFAAHNLTVTPFAGDTIDGAGSLVLNTNRQFINLVPANDGTSTGWFVE